MRKWLTLHETERDCRSDTTVERPCAVVEPLSCVENPGWMVIIIQGFLSVLSQR